MTDKVINLTEFRAAKVEAPQAEFVKLVIAMGEAAANGLQTEEYYRAEDAVMRMYVDCVNAHTKLLRERVSLLERYDALVRAQVQR